jgi:hypothetical protein
MSDWREYRATVKDHKKKYINKNLQKWANFSLILMVIFLLSKMLINVYVFYSSSYIYAFAQVFVVLLFFIIYNIKNFGDNNTLKVFVKLGMINILLATFLVMFP